MDKTKAGKIVRRRTVRRWGCDIFRNEGVSSKGEIRENGDDPLEMAVKSLGELFFSLYTRMYSSLFKRFLRVILV